MGFRDMIKAAADAVSSGTTDHESAVNSIVSETNGGLTPYGADDLLSRQIATGDMNNETYHHNTESKK